MPHVTDIPTGYVIDVAGAKAGSQWVTVVSAQLDDGRRINLVINKRAWNTAEDLFADIRANLTGIPTDYHIPLDAIGQSFNA